MKAAKHRCILLCSFDTEDRLPKARNRDGIGPKSQKLLNCILLDMFIWHASQIETGSMSCLSIAIKVVICAAISLIVVKLALDQQRVDWHSKKLTPTERCSDIVLGPEMRLDWPNWRIFADQLAQETKAADEKEGFDVIFYGDSITEQWRGSAVGAEYPSLQETHSIFESRFNTDYTSTVMAIAGDQVGHLWWRVQNGEVPIRRHPKAVVILIGTNDLTADDCLTDEEASVIAAQGVVSRVTAVLSEFRARLPNTDVILLGILPRDAHVLSGPPAYEWPNRMTQAISSANQKLQEMAAEDHKVHFLDCGAPFILPEGGLDGNILPDALHPNAAGMDLLASCLKPQVDLLVSMKMSPLQVNAGP